MANEALLLDVKHEFGIDPFNNFNVAVCSRSPSCRSAFINAIFRRYQNAVDLEKKQGVYGMVSYRDRNLPSTVFWDIPFSSIAMPDYFIRYRLFAFDCIFIVSSNTFTEMENELAVQAKKWKMPFAMVRINGYKLVKHIALKLNHSMKSSSIILRRIVSKTTPHPVFIINCAALGAAKLYPYRLFRNSRSDDSLSGLDEERLVQFLDALVDFKYSNYFMKRKAEDLKNQQPKDEMQKSIEGYQEEDKKKAGMQKNVEGYKEEDNKKNGMQKNVEGYKEEDNKKNGMQKNVEEYQEEDIKKRNAEGYQEEDIKKDGMQKNVEGYQEEGIKKDEMHKKYQLQGKMGESRFVAAASISSIHHLDLSAKSTIVEEEEDDDEISTIKEKTSWKDLLATIERTDSSSSDDSFGQVLLSAGSITKQVASSPPPNPAGQDLSATITSYHSLGQPLPSAGSAVKTSSPPHHTVGQALSASIEQTKTSSTSENSFRQAFRSTASTIQEKASLPPHISFGQDSVSDYATDKASSWNSISTEQTTSSWNPDSQAGSSSEETTWRLPSWPIVLLGVCLAVFLSLSTSIMILILFLLLLLTIIAFVFLLL